jgi:hypothetical protein
VEWLELAHVSIHWYFLRIGVEPLCSVTIKDFQKMLIRGPEGGWNNWAQHYTSTAEEFFFHHITLLMY